jgi:hypothetical protein
MRVIYLLFLFTIHCATILSPKSYPIFIQSNEKDVELTLLCESEAKKITLFDYSNVIFINAKERCNAEFKKKKFEDVKLELEYKINPAILGNFYLPGIFFLPIDIIKGYHKKPDKTNFEINMQRIK